MVIDDLESSRIFDKEMEQFIIRVETTEDVETGEIETQTNVLDEFPQLLRKVGICPH